MSTALKMGVLVGLLAGCAIGDGRGWATVDGALTIELREDEFVTPGGADGTLLGMDVGLVTLELSGDTVLETGTESRSATLGVAAAWDPVAATTTAPFGPLEIDRGDYARLTAIIGRIVIRAEVGGETHRIEIAPADGVRIPAPADLPANADRPPNITLSARLVLPDTLMDGVDPAADDAGARIQANIEAAGSIQATWSRKAD
jgi:hypothetical protein